MATDFALRRRGKRFSLRDWDFALTVAVGSLLFLGILLVYAATRDWFAANNLDPEYYLKRHTINVLIGILLAWAATLIDYRMIRAFAPIVWGVGVIGLILVLVPGIGATVNGARAWIALPGGFQIQPAELAKISIIVGMALILSDLQGNQEHPGHKDVLRALGIAALPILLIVLQPDLGTVLIISASIVTIIAVSGARSRWVFGLIAVALLGGFVAVQTGVVSEYQVKRLESFIDPNADPLYTGYQLRQSRITIGSGGLTGTGLFDGPQTSGRFVPEQQTDFIFTVAGEQLGFLGSGLIILLYSIIIFRGFAIARRSEDMFGRLVSIGVIAWFSFQTFENIGMTMGLMPMTGVPLPFLSYGGSSMFACLIGFGLLQNVHLRSSR